MRFFENELEYHNATFALRYSMLGSYVIGLELPVVPNWSLVVHAACCIMHAAPEVGWGWGPHLLRVHQRRREAEKSDFLF